MRFLTVEALENELPYGKCPSYMWCRPYGLTTFADLFTDRQLVALTTFSDLVGEARERILHDAVADGMPDDGVPLRAGGVPGRPRMLRRWACIWRLCRGQSTN